MEPLPYATVFIHAKGDSTILAGTITDEKGLFVFQGVPKGNYLIDVSFIGYEPASVPLLIGELNKVFDLGRIFLDPNARELNEVVVNARREIVSSGLDKKTFDLGENSSQAGSSVLDALRNLPGVTVSPDGKILLRGSDKVSVLIDGKQSSLTGFGNQQGLDNLPAANIARVEIITNPSAKYQSAGMAGIINIIYKEEKELGLNGEAGLSLGVGELWQRRENLPRISPKYSQTPKLNPNLSMNYRSKKANFFLQADGIVRRRVNANEFTERDYTDTTDISSQFLENRSQQLYNIKGGLDLYLSGQNTLSLFALWQDEYHIDKGDVPYDNLETGQRLRLWTWREDERTRFINYAAQFHHKFIQPGHEIKVGYMYTGGGEVEYFPFTDSSQYRVSDDQTFLTVYEYVNSFTLDYVKPLRWGRTEWGSKISLRNIPVTYTLTPGQNSILDPNLGDWSKYHEDVYAVYGNVVREAEKLDIEAGLRFEPTFVRYELDPGNAYYQDNAYEYFPLFPNLRFTFKPGETRTISVFYNRRVDRPGEFDVRPFPKYDDPEILKTGNPNLRPQFTHTMELSYKNYWETGSAYLSAFYRIIDNIYSRVYTRDTTSIYAVVNAIPANLGRGTNLGFEAVAQRAFGKKASLNASFSWYRHEINAFSGVSYYPYPQPFQSPESSINTWNFKVIFNLKLPGQTDLQLSSVYYAPDLVPQGRVKDRYSLDLGIKKLAATDRLELRFSFTDILNTFEIEKEIKSADFNLKAYNYYETQVITLGAKYKF